MEYIGIDFGTTNSALAIASQDRSLQLATFQSKAGMIDVFRSVLYFEQDNSTIPRKVKAYAGPDAIDRYLTGEVKGRFIQSLKSYLASSLFTSTNVFGHSYSLQDLIAYLLRCLTANVLAPSRSVDRLIFVGRPVRFVGSDSVSDDNLALSRLTAALEGAGVGSFTFEYEPVAAAYFYEARLIENELILVADFGGGTSDFSLLEVGPTPRAKGSARTILATAGIGIAGDSFDASFVRKVVSPLLGSGTNYRSLGKILSVPAWPYGKLEHWHHLSLLNNRETMNLLNSLAANAEDANAIRMFIQIIKADMGFYLHRAVQECKNELSEQNKSSFSFYFDDVKISRLIRRDEFEGWIKDDLDQIRQCVIALLQRARISPSRVDRVFLTGGSSLVPAVRRIFAELFGGSKLAGGGEFTSVAQGLALRAIDARDPLMP